MANQVEIQVGAQDNTNLDLDRLKARIEDLKKQRATIPIDVKDKEATLALARVDAQIMSLQRRLDSTKMGDLGAARALVGIETVSVALDRLKEKQKVKGSGLLGMVQGGIMGGVSWLEKLGPIASASVPAIAAAGAALVLATPAIVGAGVALAGFAGFAALAIPVVTNLAGALSTTRAASQAYTQASENLNTAIHKSPADMKAYQATIHGLEPDLQNAAKLLTDQNVKWQNLSPSMRKSVVALYDNKGAYASLLPDQKAALQALLKQKTAWDDLTPAQQGLAKSLQGLGGQFAKLQKAIEPYVLKAFAEGLKIVKDLMPAFKPLVEAAGRALDGLLGKMDDWLRSPSGQKFIHWLEATGPKDIANFGRVLWDLAAGFGNVITFMDRWGNIGIHNLRNHVHSIAVFIDYLRESWVSTGHVIEAAWNYLRASWVSTGHAIESAWNTLWRNTVTRAQNGIDAVTAWFHKLPGRVIDALFGLGHQLYAFAHAALNEFWNGLKSVAGSIFGWVGHFVSTIWDKVKGFFGIHSPSSLFYGAGKNLMLGLFHGIKDHAHHAASAARNAMGAVSGALGGDAAANERLARRMFPWPASQWPAFYNLEMAEAGFNRFARNPSSGAYGIPQALPESKMPFAGQSAGGSHAGAQLSWMFDYIRSVYGSPAAAWAHEMAQHWYGSGGIAGGLIGVGEHGRELIRVPQGSMVYSNAQSRAMTEGGGRSGASVTLRIGGSHGHILEQALKAWITETVRVDGGGSVEVAFGS